MFGLRNPFARRDGPVSVSSQPAQIRGQEAAASDLEADGEVLGSLHTSARASGMARAPAPHDPTVPYSTAARTQARLDAIPAEVAAIDTWAADARQVRDDADARLAAVDAPRAAWDGLLALGALALACVGGLAFEPTFALFLDAHLAERLLAQGVPLTLIQQAAGTAIAGTLTLGHLAAGRARAPIWGLLATGVVELATLAGLAWFRADLIAAESASGNASVALAALGGAAVAGVEDAANARTWLLFAMESLVVVASIGAGLTLGRHAAARAARGELVARASSAAREVERLEQRARELTAERVAIEKQLADAEAARFSAVSLGELLAATQELAYRQAIRENNALAVGVEVKQGQLRLVE
jgi:hypothetical protein